MLNEQLKQGLKDSGLNITTEEWRLLFYLWEEDHITQKTLAEVANKEKSTITRQLDTLEKKDMIQRVSQNEDKRNNLIVLTTKGKEIETEALNVARQITMSAEKGLTEADLEVFRRVANQIIQNLLKEE